MAIEIVSYTIIFIGISILVLVYFVTREKK